MFHTHSYTSRYAEFYTQLVNARKRNEAQRGRVARIYIHKVVGVDPKEEKDLNDPKRFEKAFKDIPREIWKVFESPQELYAELDGLKREVQGKGGEAGKQRRKLFGLI